MTDDTETGDLARAICEPCRGGIPPMTTDAAQALMTQLHGDWVLAPDARSLTRRFTFKGFARPVQLANLAAWLGEKEGHHPDIAFGWGYCAITYTTHDIGGLSRNDFICAARLDRIVA